MDNISTLDELFEKWIEKQNEENPETYLPKEIPAYSFDKDGYVCLYGVQFREHPRYKKTGLLEHVYVMEKHLGKKSKPSLRDYERMTAELTKIFTVPLKNRTEQNNSGEDDGEESSI
mgnify:CR=1 FL=1